MGMFVIARSITSSPSPEPSAGSDRLTSKLMLDKTVKEYYRGEAALPTDAMGQQLLRYGSEYGLR